MKNHHCSSTIHVAPQFCGHLKEAIRHAKERLRQKYEEVYPDQGHEVVEALEEAEDLAWSTPFPHLFLPDFAEIRVNARAAQSGLAVAA